MRTVFVCRDFQFCPYCANQLLPMRDELKQRANGTHVFCPTCLVCLTCEEQSARGWVRNHPAPKEEARTVPR